MVSKFYSDNGGDSGGVGYEHTGGEEGKNKFPEDPGMENGKIPDGGGPADGFIDDEGHNSGKGFLNHVYEGEDTRAKHSDDGGSNTGQA